MIKTADNSAVSNEDDSFIVLIEFKLLLWDEPVVRLARNYKCAPDEAPISKIYTYK